MFVCASSECWGCACLFVVVHRWGPWVFALLGSHTGLAVDDAPGVEDWLGEGGHVLAAAGAHDALKFVRRRVYDVQCNWKVRRSQ
jgi:hypothetical protein